MLKRRTSTSVAAFLALCALAGGAPALAEPPRPRPHAAVSEGTAATLARWTFAPGSADASGCADAPDLTAALAWAGANPEGLIILDGHADPSATQAHSLRLALQRTKAVRSQLLEAGMNPEQIVIATFGADGPRDRSVIVWGAPSNARVATR